MSPTSPFQRASDDKRVAFLSELLAGANAREAAARAGLNRGSVYRWKLEDAEFAAVWAEIVASRPRRRNLRRRVLGPALGPALCLSLGSVSGPERHPESSHSVSHDKRPVPARETLWDAALGPVAGPRW